jgi:3-hydroxyacyl-[acyl-carrier-protein] dehydratase
MSDRSGAFPSVESVLPHRPPFLFLDRILECTQERVVGARTFRPDEPLLGGHFPGRPVVPAVVLLEALGQAMAYHSLLHHPSREILLVGVDHARFRRLAELGVEVCFEVQVGERRAGLTRGEGEVTIAEIQIARATLLGYSADPSSPNPIIGGTS